MRGIDPCMTAGDNERIASATFNGHRLATVFHDAGGREFVVFCHGFQSQKTGPSRFFVRAARTLAAQGISSLRFDQYGCGDSPGDSTESSFGDWVATTRAIAEHYLAAGHRVALFGQSMGGSAAIAAASDLPRLTALVAWVPDANVEPFVATAEEFLEESSQLVRPSYWREACDARVAERFERVDMPAYLVFGTADWFVNEENRRALIERAKPQHKVDVFEGYVHSAWTYEQATDIIQRSCGFLVDAFAQRTEAV